MCISASEIIYLLFVYVFVRFKNIFNDIRNLFTHKTYPICAVQSLSSFSLHLPFFFLGFFVFAIVHFIFVFRITWSHCHLIHDDLYWISNSQTNTIEIKAWFNTTRLHQYISSGFRLPPFDLWPEIERRDHEINSNQYTRSTDGRGQIAVECLAKQKKKRPQNG